MLKRILVLILVLSALFLPGKITNAQDEGPAIYIIQPGDTLYSIAIRFGVSVNDILTYNNLSDADLIGEGTQLRIPGLDGVTGILTSETVRLGSTLSSLSISYQIPAAELIRLNRITSPSEIFIGANLILPLRDENGTFPEIFSILASESLLETAASQSINPWLAAIPGEENPSLKIPGDLFVIPGQTEAGRSEVIISPIISEIEINSLPLVQGSTAAIHITATEQITISGTLANRELHFFPGTNYEYFALQGIYRMLKPGIYPLALQVSQSNGKSSTIEQSLLIAPMAAIYDYPLSVDPVTVDPNNTKPEDELVSGVLAPATSTKYWNGLFTPPIDIPSGYAIFPDCTTSRYGNLRAYNDGPYNYFHTGLDLSACGNNLNIYAAAPGKIVYAGPLTVRGNYTVIDHGWGVYTAYGHQSQLDVSVGDTVEAGQLIGLIGATGRVAGPHLHWEVWVNGVQVEPLDWLDITHP